MTQKIQTFFHLSTLGLMSCAPTWAHDGHGLHGSHWHASDSTGFIIALVLVVAAWALGQRK